MLPDMSLDERVRHERCRRSTAAMATTVTVEVVVRRASDRPAIADAIVRALDWFAEVEATCSRFLETSELSRLSCRAGEPVAVSPMLMEAVAMSIAIAEASSGAFDPTVGALLAERGFDRSHQSGMRVSYPGRVSAGATYRDVVIDRERSTITLARPLVLDLGAVAKGLAVDLAARELSPFEHFAVSAGGDLYLGGLNADEEPWSVGIRHPREDGAVIEQLRVSDTAVCTSGDYERRQPGTSTGHHLIDCRSGQSVHALASVTVKAQTALVADGLATAAFVLGPEDGLRLLEGEGVEGLLLSPSLVRHATRGW
jgi:thiamine biosynthesis lipoprotein